MSKNFGICIQKGRLNKGNVRPVDDRYFQVLLGTLEEPNSTGAVYDYESAVNVIERSRLFKQVIEQGLLKGELGHPVESECKDYNDFVRRIHIIDERNVAFHIRRVWIERNHKLPDGRTVIAILGEICPSGPHGEHFRKSLLNPDENVAFSVRSMTDDRIVNGRKRKFFTNILTWDTVYRPGLHGSHKFNSPSCESHIGMEVVESVPITTGLMNIMRNELTRNPQSHGVSLESSLAAFDYDTRIVHRGKSSLESW